VQCPACDTGNEPTRKFCRECGGPLALRCPSCGTGNAPSDKFCGAERRLVSVLFIDLVGFTTLSERRDAEDVRELLTRDFKAAAGLLRELGFPFWLRVTLLEHGELLTGQRRPDDAAPLLDEAGTIFERLKARPWTERLRRVAAPARTEAAP
jgi:double zinc ribbon protein